VNIAQFIITFFTIFILALTLSADDFSVGVAYGLYKKKITLKSLIVMVIGSATSTYGAMLIGKFIFTSMPEYLTAWLSAAILATIGCKMLYEGYKGRKDKSEYLKVKPSADGELRKTSLWENYIVGFGLGIDDFAQALGLSLAGFPIILTVFLLEAAEMIAILSGNYLAFKGLSKKVNGKLAIIPGIVLILVAIYQIVS
jgi:putative Mn2+ efflux pump MntP